MKRVPVRLPPPTHQEETGFPVTVYDAEGWPTIYEAAEWREQHVAALCPHGNRHCFACRHRLTNHRGVVPVPRQTDADLLAAIAG